MECKKQFTKLNKFINFSPSPKDSQSKTYTYFASYNLSSIVCLAQILTKKDTLTDQNRMPEVDRCSNKYTVQGMYNNFKNVKETTLVLTNVFDIREGI